MVEPGIEPGTSWLVVRSSDHQTTRLDGFQEVDAPKFQDNRHMKVVRLSALRTGRLYPPGNIPGNNFC